jgi:hypothetical protein
MAGAILMICYNRSHTNNVGDKYASPNKYFNLGQDKDIEGHIDYDDDILIGGGGMLYYKKKIEEICRNKKKRLIFWSGVNSHNINHLDYPSFMDRFDIIGSRDWNSGFDWVPCPSCLHPSFTQNYEIKREIGIYSHHRKKLSKFDNIDIHHNNEKFDEIIAFLGSCEIIITNSYHGLYWGTILGRKMILVDPFSNRFFYTKHKPIICSRHDALSKRHSARAYPEALAECREAVQLFGKKLFQSV